MTDLLARKHAHFFNMLDKNQDQVLERADFVKFLDSLTSIRRWSPESPEYQRSREIVMSWWNAFKQAADTDDNGRVSCDEFTSVLAQADVQAFAEVANWLFDILDADGAGTISAEEYRQLEAAVMADDSGARDTFAKIDQDGDGRLSREEFIAVLVEYQTSKDEHAPGNALFSFR